MTAAVGRNDMIFRPAIGRYLGLRQPAAAFRETALLPAAENPGQRLPSKRPARMPNADRSQQGCMTESYSRL